MTAAPAPRRDRRERRRPSAFWIMAPVVVPFVGYFAKIRIEGAENLPETGPFVLAPNHYTKIDPLIVAVAVWRLGRAPRFMLKDSLLRVPVVGPVLRWAGMIPVGRGGGPTRASAGSLSTVDALTSTGAGVIVYPEGTLTRDPELWPMRGKTGAARLALAGGMPLVPMAHWGSEQFLPRYGRFKLWPPRRPVRLVFGPPMDVPPADPDHPHVSAVELTDRLMGEITDLVAGLRDETPPQTRWNPTEHGQSETGRLESEG